MADLEVTSVTIRPFSSEDEKLRAFATIILNNAFVVKDLKVIEGNNGRFVAMPSRRGKNGVFHDIAHPLNQEIRAQIERVVLDAYEAEIAHGPRKDGVVDDPDDDDYHDQPERRTA